ncbi:MAG: hypothetical protein FWH56_09840 [Betaproteobacteria bacterium]|nr:hypothetical protein [Betaproteobacteria bacterium]
MKFGKFFWAFVASISLISSVQATPPNWRSVDADTLDIAGVKLGMDYDQVISAMTDHFKLSPTEVKSLKAGTTLKDDPLTKTKQPGYVIFRKDGISMEVSFRVRSPIDNAHPVGATSIKYMITNTPQNVSMLKETALAKYGPPSDDRHKTILHWCANFQPSVTCNSKEASLEHGSGYLILKDYNRYK